LTTTRRFITLMAAFGLGVAFGQTPVEKGRMKTRPMPELPVMLSYKLTSPKLTQYIQASRNVTTLLKKDPGYRQRMALEPKTAPKTIDESVAFVRKSMPELYAAVETSGMPFREYTIFQGCLLSAWVVANHPRPGSKIQIQPENIQFVMKNHALIESALAEQHR
jgi:hypothetical protein